MTAGTKVVENCHVDGGSDMADPHRITLNGTTMAVVYCSYTLKQGVQRRENDFMMIVYGKKLPLGIEEKNIPSLLHWSCSSLEANIVTEF